MSDRPFDPYVPPLDDDSGDDPLDLAPVDENEDATSTLERLEKRAVRIPIVVVGLMALVGTLVLVFGDFEGLAAANTEERPVDTEELPVLTFDPNEPFTFSSLDIHPDKMFAAYFGGAFLSGPGSDSMAAVHGDFRYRLGMYEDAYGVDDNFSIRVLDERSGETLEIYTLSDLKAAYRASGNTNWGGVDFPGRRAATNRLLDKWEARGVPRAALTVRWGRANQTLEARKRDERFVQYEVQLARRLGLSLLATEIGTVETFNQDNLVSSVGARSRYQMMPDILSTFNVERYAIPTVGGQAVSVSEELHPLLAMEPSLMLVRAYSNAVGHELPGISAYHTGPGNLYHLYQAYLRAHAAKPPLDGHVSDAYMWGVTDGFTRVRAESSFGPESRAYVMKAYGALRATEDLTIDPKETLHVDRVQIKAGSSITLTKLLDALSGSDRRLDWGVPEADSLSLYNRFRALNPHMSLPRTSGDDVPANGNLVLSATADGDPVRFFLPTGATDVLRRVGLDVIGSVFPFDDDTFLVQPSEITPADERYTKLVNDIGDWGFSIQNKRVLDRLVDEFDALAARNPDSRYRQTQAKIARIHRGIWNTRSFRDLAGTVETLMAIVPQRQNMQARAGETTSTAG